MKRCVQALSVFVVVVLGCIPMLAHDEFRVIGIVTKKLDTSIQVKSKTGKTFAIGLTKDTKVSRDKRKVDAAELKMGLTVVVDALGDSEDDLAAVEVRIVPAIVTPTAK